MNKEQELREALSRMKNYSAGMSMPMDLFDSTFALVIAAAESTLPKARELVMWHVEWSNGDVPRIDDPYGSESEARRAAGRAERAGKQCVRVTGPHKHLVPA